MAKYLFNCNKCTNKLYRDGYTYCKPIAKGHSDKACKIVSGTTGKDFVFGCKSYTTEPVQLELNLWEVRR